MRPEMDYEQLANQIIDAYSKHGWRLKRVLLQPDLKLQLMQQTGSCIISSDVPVKESEVNALWFARPSHGNREAWELRLLAETPFALFETFEADETEEEREDVRLEMEARLRLNNSLNQ